MSTTARNVIRYAEVRAVLADPRFTVPPVPAHHGGLGIAWLRSRVSRFSTGAAHERRRALAVAELARLSPTVLCGRAGALAAATLPGPAGRSPEVAEVAEMAEMAEAVPVGVLAEALGITAPVGAEVAVVARAYHPDTADDPDADHAVAYLVDAVGGATDDVVAARIGLLVQAYAATAGLIRNAVSATGRLGLAAPVSGLLAETLRHDPPVRATRRRSVVPARIGDTDVPAGCLVRLDLAAANRDPAVFTDPDRFDPARPERDRHLTLGAGLRPCPGRDHALAIATGVLHAVGPGAGASSTVARP